MIIVLRSVANGQLVSMWDQVIDQNGAAHNVLQTNRSAAGIGEQFELLVQAPDGSLQPFPFPPPSPQPQPRPDPIHDDPIRDYRAWFLALVADKPFSQRTLLDLEPKLNASNVKLTPPNSVGERTKIGLPDGTWVRVGFGEGHWVWLVQS